MIMYYPLRKSTASHSISHRARTNLTVWLRLTESVSRQRELLKRQLSGLSNYIS